MGGVNVWQSLITAILTLAGSTGFWAWMQRRDTVRQAHTQLLLGIAYDRITDLGMKYIARGWVTQDEYEEFRKLMYEPYKAMGGNGTAERVMAAVANLPLKPRSAYAELLRESRRTTNESAIDAVEQPAPQLA